MRKNIILLSCVLLFVLINVLYSTPHSVRKTEIETNTSTINEHNFIYNDNQEEPFANPQLSYPAPPVGDLDVKIVTTLADCKNSTITVTLIGSAVSNIVNSFYTLKEISYVLSGTTSAKFENIPDGSYTLNISVGFNDDSNKSIDTTIVVNGNYIEPAITVNNIRPVLLNCQKGSVLLKLNGRLPYKISIYKNETKIGDTTFSTPESNNIYSVENLSAGKYSFKLMDSCGIDPREVSTTVDSIREICSMINPVVCENSEDPSSYNKININFFKYATSKNQYYNEHVNGIKTWFEYSFNGGAWTDVPVGNALIADNSATKYCDMWNHAYPLKLRVKDCDDSICSINVAIKEPHGTIRFYTEKASAFCITDSIRLIVEADSSAFCYYTMPVTATASIGGSSYTSAPLHGHDWYYKWSDVIIPRSKSGQLLNVKVTDANGCLIMNKDSVIYFDDIAQVLENSWTCGVSVSPCGSSRIWVSSIDSFFNDTVELIQSPTNKYSFSVTYNSVDKKWDTISSSLSGASLRCDGAKITLSDVGMPEGEYKWYIRNRCKSDTVSLDTTFTYKISDSLYIETNSACGNIIKPHGQIVMERNGNEIPLPTLFNVYEKSTNKYIAANKRVNIDSIIINTPGDYVVHMYYRIYNDATNYGCLWDRDTITVYSSMGVDATVVGYACEKNGLGHIIAKVDSTIGLAPYKFELYSQSNLGGTLLETNNTGIFDSVKKVNETLSMRISNACAISTIRNFRIGNISISIGVPDNKNICFGDVISLNANGLPSILETDAISYTWRGPDGNVLSNEKSINLVNSGTYTSGKYHLSLGGLACDVDTSVYLNFLPENKQIFNNSICEGENYSNNILTINTKDSLPGEYHFVYDSVKSYTGCDSTVIVNLTINPTPTTVIDTIIDFNGVYDNKNGIYRTMPCSDTIRGNLTYLGCDSIIILNLKIRPKVIIPDAIDPSDFSSFSHETGRYRNQFGPLIGVRLDKALPETEYEYKMIIFNRWNTTIFEANKMMDEAIDPLKHYWDGTHKRKVLPEDGYLYYIKIKFKDIDYVYEKKGVVSIIYK